MTFPERPTVLVGAARSGTSILSQMLGEHASIAYWGENDHIWRYGHAFRSSDVIQPAEATPRIKTHIRSQLLKRLAQFEGDHLLEKTPGNCFRIPFILEVLPEARFIHIIRDGRDVAFSAADVWAGGRLRARRVKNDSSVTCNGTVQLKARDKIARVPWILRMFRSKLRPSYIEISDLQSFLIFLERAKRGIDFFRRHFMNNSSIPWGPHFPGLQAIRHSYSLLETCALQWCLSVQSAQSALMQLPKSRHIEVRYEDLVQNPSREIKRTLDFMEIAYTDEIIDRIITKIDGRSTPSWPRNLTMEEVHAIERQVGSMLAGLDYPLEHDEQSSYTPEFRLEN